MNNENGTRYKWKKFDVGGTKYEVYLPSVYERYNKKTFEYDGVHSMCISVLHIWTRVLMVV